MGLLEKKTCMVCGKKTGINGTRLADGHLCFDCSTELRNVFLDERESFPNDSFSYSNIALQELQNCAKWFTNGNIIKKMTKGFPQYLGTFAYDEANQILEVIGKKSVYRIPADTITSVLYHCYDFFDAGKPKFSFLILSDKLPWLDSYVFTGTFKNNAFLKSKALKYIAEDVQKLYLDTGIPMLLMDEVIKQLKKNKRGNQINALKDALTKI